ncbi:hypothetical protein BLA28_09950 [Eisenbergiella tayi]|nr:hypothetical protein BLA28_09950 [Eisenbergiella tayi]
MREGNPGGEGYLQKVKNKASWHRVGRMPFFNGSFNFQAAVCRIRIDKISPRCYDENNMKRFINCPFGLLTAGITAGSIFCLLS